MAQQFQALVALAEVRGSVFSTYTVGSQLSIAPAPRNQMPFVVLHGHEVHT